MGRDRGGRDNITGMDDEEAQAFLAERRRADDRRRMIARTDPQIAPALGPAMQAMRSLLADGEAHGYVEVLAAGLKASSEVTIKTLDNCLRRLANAGMVEREGDFRPRRIPADSRTYRLLDWPLS